MKLVLNGDYGCFGCGVAKSYQDLVDDLATERDASELVEFVENHPNDCGDLQIVEIPDEATDWDIDDNNGIESVIYVVNGKLYRKW